MPTLGASAALLIALILLFWRRSHPSAGMSGKPHSTQGSEVTALIVSGTTLLATLWAGMGAYAGLLAVRDSETSPLWWSGFLVGLIVVWAALERWRWGRWALIGMAGAVVFDVTQAAARLASVGGFGALGGPRDFARELLHASGRGPTYDLALVALAMATIIWFTRSDVGSQFEARKRALTRRYQWYIAGVLTAIFAGSVLCNGMARGVQGRIAARLLPVGAASLNWGGLLPRSPAVAAPNGDRRRSSDLANQDDED